MHEVLSSAEVDGAISRYFRGSRTLYEAFRASCLPQFLVDIDAMDLGFRNCSDTQVRQIAHNLKSALTMLGLEQTRAKAQSVELAAQAGLLTEARSAWRDLRTSLLALSST